MAFTSLQLQERSLMIVVCGAGTMGSGIAQLCAQSGFSTVLYDLHEAVLEKGRTAITASLEGLVTRQKISASEKENILQRLRFSNQLNDCIGDLVIEAIVEKAEIKSALFNQLAELNHSETVFATNTSSLSIAAIAATVVHPERVAGLHFFNPAPVMKLVEVVKAPQTDAAIANSLEEFATALGKTPVRCIDAPGFIVNHVARPYYLESLRLTEDYGIPVETTDALLEATGFKMGPFRLMDLIGNDINYAVSCSVYEQLGQPERLKPSRLQQQKVEEGALGKKTGQGYYRYS